MPLLTVTFYTTPLFTRTNNYNTKYFVTNNLCTILFEKDFSKIQYYKTCSTSHFLNLPTPCPPQPWQILRIPGHVRAPFGTRLSPSGHSCRRSCICMSSGGWRRTMMTRVITLSSSFVASCVFEALSCRYLQEACIPPVRLN